MDYWIESQKNNKIGIRYANVNFDNNNLLHPDLIEKGKIWIRSKNKPSLYLTGNAGSGKTYFTLCLVRTLAENGNPWHIFAKSHDMDTEFLKSILENQEDYIIDKYRSVPYLFIDDLGVERPNERVIKQYYSILDHRVSNCMTTVITTNQKLENIDKILGERIGSRLQGFYTINFPDIDLRKKQGKPS